MSLKPWWVVFVLATFVGHAQYTVKGAIYDAHTNVPISYANVYLQKNAGGTVAFSNGSFALKLGLYRDSLVISIIGYKRKTLFLPDLGDNQFIRVGLYERRQPLAEAVVQPREMKAMEIGLTKNRASHQTGAAPEKPSARYIPNEQQLEGFIKNVAVYISNKGVPEAPFRLNVLSVNKVTGAPDRPLINEDFITKAAKGNEWVTIDLEKRLVSFPSEGIFVAIQPLPIDSIQMAEYRAKYPEITEGRMRVSAPQFGYRWEKCEQAARANWSYGWTEERGWRPHWRDLYVKLDSSKNVATQRASSLMIKAEISYYANQELKVKELKTKRVVKKVLDRPKENTLEYPQSSPGYLIASLKKAVEQDEFAYMCSYLLYYEDEEELEETMDFVAVKMSEAGSVLFSQKEKDEMIITLTELEMKLDNLKANGDNRFIFELEHEGAMFYFQNKNGAWKINPRSTSMIKREMKIPAKF